MFDRHLLMASRDSATSSARFSHSSSSGRADLKIKPTWLSRSLNCDVFFFVANLEHARHWVREGGNCSVVQSLLHVGHCLLIAVANALHHHPFLRVLWLGHMSSRSLKRSWLVINDAACVAVCVAVCCSVCCSALQCVALCCSVTVLQCFTIQCPRA
jgi:hypothetical protein